MPKAACSPSCQPAPRPRMKWPPVAWSMTVAALASTAGWRKVLDRTAWPIHLPGTWWARVAAQGEGLQARPGRLSQVGEVVVHPHALEDGQPAAEGPCVAQGRPVDTLRRRLEAQADVALHHGPAAGRSVQAGRAASRDPAGTRVTAPSLAELTSAAYLAMTPVAVVRRGLAPAPGRGAPARRPRPRGPARLPSTSMTIGSPSCDQRDRAAERRLRARRGRSSGRGCRR